MILLLKILILSAAVFITARILPGVQLKEAKSAFLVAVVLALLNAFVKPVMVVLTIPFTILTLGLFLWIINAVLIIIAEMFVPDFKLKNFGWALIFSLVLTLCTSAIENVVESLFGQTLSIL